MLKLLALALLALAIVVVGAVPVPVDTAVPVSLLPESDVCEYRTTIVLAVGQTRLITPAFFDEGNRTVQAPDNLQWQFGPASIGAVLPIFGSSSAYIRGDAVGTGTLQLIDLSTGNVLASADVCVFTPSPDTEAVRAELDLD